MNESSYLNMTTEEQSFVNLVTHFGPELRRIMTGELSGDVIPERTTRRTLHRHGVLTGRKPRKNDGTINGTSVTVTEEAKRVLDFSHQTKRNP